jgi:hypothetical protein
MLFEAVVITVLNAYSGFALVAEGERQIQALSMCLTLDRLHAGQPPPYDGGFADWCQWYNPVIYYGTCHMLLRFRVAQTISRSAWR